MEGVACPGGHNACNLSEGLRITSQGGWFACNLSEGSVVEAITCPGGLIVSAICPRGQKYCCQGGQSARLICHRGQELKLLLVQGGKEGRHVSRG